MKMYRIEDYVNFKNPTSGESYRPEILKEEHNARNLGGMFGLLVPGSKVPYHYHQNRESVIIFISGEGLEIIEGEEYLIKAGDVIFIPAGEKHMTINSSDSDLRYLEFFTCPPVTADFFEVKE